MTGSPFTILTFHSIEEAANVLSYDPHTLDVGLTALAQRGLRTMTVAEVGRLLHAGAPLPPDRFSITFDDGYRTVYDQALPLLQRHDMVATVFLTVGPSGPTGPSDRLPPMLGREMLSWREIRELHGAGIEIGAHTLTHPDLRRLPREDLDREIVRSQEIIEDGIGASVSSFAYPFGRHDAASRDIVREHFAVACSDRLGFVTRRSDAHALERIDAYYLRAAALLSSINTEKIRWYIAARSVPRRIRRMMEATRR